MTDADASTAYFLFRKHHIPPQVYYRATLQEQIVLRAFVRQEAEDIEEEMKDIKG